MQPERGWQSQSGNELLRRRPLRRLASIVTERGFTYGEYDRFLARLAGRPDVRLAPLRELASASGHTVVALRHDVDDRLDSALRVAELEHARGLSATFFVLHTARYYRHDERFLTAVRRIQELGHEVGWHNDLVTLDLVHGVDPVAYLAQELEWLRSKGVDVTGVAAHGSIHCHRLGFHNDEFFLDWVPATEGRRQAQLADFGLAYDAGHLDVDRYYSDATFDAGGRRWHPALLPVETLPPGLRVIVLVHPCHWDSSIAAKARRVLTRLAAAAASPRTRGRAATTYDSRTAAVDR